MRKLQPKDAPELARLIHTIWPDDNPDPARIARVSLDPSKLTLIEEADGQIVGFVSAFPTLTVEGASRWEVDLLGVHPACRGRGIARGLTEAVVEAGRGYGAKAARALIRIGNTASLNTFLRCGFSLDPTILDLYVADGEGGVSPTPPPGLHLIPVETLTYAGTWVEGDFSLDNLLFSRAVGMGTVGVLIPVGSLAAEAAGFENAGQFQWVTRTL